MTAAEPTLKKTPLFELHRELGARLVGFAGWQMPVEFAGVIEEHLAVRGKVGLFDVSHMGEFFVEGPGACALLQHLTPNDVSRLVVGQAQYTALTTETGGFVDDLVVYRLGEERYLLVVNAANVTKDFEWISRHLQDGVELTDASDDYALLALQGPEAQATLESVTDVDLAALKFFRFAHGAVLGEETMVSRTGYTGEDGFELLIEADRAENVARGLLEQGKRIEPAGLGARDTLRLEAKLPLHGNDIDEEHTVLEADLGWIVKWGKGDFIGRGALERQKERGIERKLVGFEMQDRGIARHGYPVFVDGEPFEAVTSGSYTPYLKKNIGLCYLPIQSSGEGTAFEVEIRGRRAKARVVPTPFYKREKKNR